MAPRSEGRSMSDEAHAHLLFAFRRILRPLVKILVRAGIRFDEFCETVKGVYVESAVRDGLGPLGRATRARIAFVTGVPRREVDRYVDDASLLAAPRPTEARTLTEVLHLWHTDPAYQGPYGVPLELDFAKRGSRSFAELVRRVDVNADPASILDELLRAGVVTGSVDRSVKVLTRAYVVPEPMSASMLEHFGSTIANLASTLEFNITEAGEKRIERSVFADRGLPEDMIPQFDAYVRTRVDKLIEDIDDWLGDMAKQPPPKGTTRVDTGLTVFHYVRSRAADPPLSSVVGND